MNERINEVLSTLPVIEPDIEEELFDDRPKYKRTITANRDGEIIDDVTKHVKSSNGSGFVISYTEKMCEFISKTSTGSIVRVFVYIAHHQAYGTNGQFGYRCSHKYLREVLHLDKSTLWDALKYLKESFLVNEIRVNGQSEFMVNPLYVTIGTDKKTRMREWSKRWEQHWKKVHQSSSIS